MGKWLGIFARERGNCECGCSKVLHADSLAGAACALCGYHCPGYTPSRATSVPSGVAEGARPQPVETSNGTPGRF